MSDFLERLNEKQKKRPMINCKTHGKRPVGFQCMACAQEQVDQLGGYKEMVLEARKHLLAAANDCERFGRQLKRMEDVFAEIMEVTHEQYCVGQAWTAQNEHHAACTYLTQIKAELDEENRLEGEANAKVQETSVDNRSDCVGGETAESSEVVDGGHQIGSSADDAKPECSPRQSAD